MILKKNMVKGINMMKMETAIKNITMKETKNFIIRLFRVFVLLVLLVPILLVIIDLTRIWPQCWCAVFAGQFLVLGTMPVTIVWLIIERVRAKDWITYKGLFSPWKLPKFNLLLFAFYILFLIYTFGYHLFLK